MGTTAILRTSTQRPSRAGLRALAWALAAAALSAPMTGCGGDNGVTGTQVESVTLRGRYSGPRYAGTFYSGFLPATDLVVWIETGSGEYVQTLSVTPEVVSVGSYSHVEHLPAWQASTGLTYADLEADLEEGTQDGIARSFDGLTRASVLFEDEVADTTFRCEWDLGEAAGIKLKGTRFRYCAEAANITGATRPHT
jgi:hypothetical protein